MSRLSSTIRKVIFLVLFTMNGISVSAVVISYDVLSIVPTYPNVGEPITMEVQLTEDTSEYNVVYDYTYVNTSAINIFRIYRKSHTEPQTVIAVVFYAKIPGLVEFPHIYLDNTMISLPPVKILSVLDQLMDFLPIPASIPWNVIIYSLVTLVVLCAFFLVSIKIAAMFLSVLRNNMGYVHNFFNLIKNVKAIRRLIRYIDLIDTPKVKIPFTTVDIYKKLRAVILSRFIFVYGIQVSSYTNAELSIHVKNRINSMREYTDSDVDDFFQSLDRVEYGDQNIALDKRRGHCLLLLKIITHTWGIPSEKHSNSQGTSYAWL